MIVLEVKKKMVKNSTNKPATNFASAEKAAFAKIESSYHSLKNNPLLRMFQEAMPDLALIINANRQLVYANTNLVRFLEIEDDTIPLGERLGNLLNCIHSDEEPSGCGTTEACRFCGVVNAVLESQCSGKPVVKEARITALMNKEEVIPYDLKIKASPLQFNDQVYTILCITDISDRKRLAILETSYMNEVFDVASELKEVVSSINKKELDHDNRSIIETVEKVNYGLVNDLLAQKMLNEAEDGTLVTNISLCNSVRLFKELEQYYSTQEIAKGIKLFIDPFSHSINFQSDKNIITRVLLNLLNNAFEAATPPKIVKAGVRLHDKTLCFSIYSQAELPEEAKHQVFQRSFSTKGKNRGLGTYSARLLTAKYLKGRIYFTSDACGTTFFVEIPLHID